LAFGGSEPRSADEWRVFSERSDGNPRIAMTAAPERRCSGLEHLLERDDPFSASARRGA
jgi:hypothetical protein